MRRFLTIATAVLLLLLPASAFAATATRGGDLGRTSDAGFGCETRFIPPLVPGGEFQPFPFGDTTCTVWGADPDIARSGAVPGTGTVTRVRVKSGPNPAPLRVSILRLRTRRNANDPNQIATVCCSGVSEGPVFQPTPNAISESVVNLPVQVTQTGLDGTGDIVAVSAVGPGEMPLSSTGPHTSEAAQSPGPKANFYYPKFEPGSTNETGLFQYPNYMPLVQFDWTDGCPGAAGARAEASQCSPTPPVNPTPPTNPTPPVGETKAAKAPFSVRGRTLRLEKGKVKLRVRCTAPRGQRCRGRVSLRTRGRKPKPLASKRVNIRGGRRATVTLELSRKARNRVRRRRNKVRVVINLGAAGKASKNLTLRR